MPDLGRWAYANASAHNSKELLIADNDQFFAVGARQRGLHTIQLLRGTPIIIGASNNQRTASPFELLVTNNHGWGHAARHGGSDERDGGMEHLYVDACAATTYKELGLGWDLRAGFKASQPCKCADRINHTVSPGLFRARILNCLGKPDKNRATHLVPGGYKMVLKWEDNMTSGPKLEVQQLGIGKRGTIPLKEKLKSIRENPPTQPKGGKAAAGQAAAAGFKGGQTKLTSAIAKGGVKGAVASSSADNESAVSPTEVDPKWTRSGPPGGGASEVDR